MSGVRLYHGTDTLSWARSQQLGGIGAKFDPQPLAAEIEAEFGLAAGSVWRHPANEFSHTRVGDAAVYLTGNAETACYYASIGSEVLHDTLRAAFALTSGESEWRPGGKERLAAFTAAWRERHQMEPLVLTIELPYEAVPVPEHSKIQDVGEWLALVHRPPQSPLDTLVVPGPLPVDWVVVVEPPAPAMSV